MTQKDREIQRRLRILKHAEETGHVGRTCRYFDIGQASFYRWKAALEKHGEAGLVRRKSIGTVRNLVRGAIVMERRTTYGNRQGPSGPVAGWT